MNNLTKTLINRMSMVTNTPLTDRHFEILEYAFNYYEKHRVGPLYQNIKKQTGATKDEIGKLFPHALNSVYTWVGIPIQSTNDLCKPMAMVEVEDYREVYFDHNGTTYVRDEIKNLLIDYYSGKYGFGNPSSSTKLGKTAYDIVQKARNQISSCLNVSPQEVIFTGCGSESNNMALKGIAFKHLEKKGHIITSKTEHPSVLKTTQFLEQLGFDVTYLGIDSDGCVTSKSVEKSIRADTILVSIMAVNNEIGTINPISEIGKICSENNIPFMVDAMQAFGKIKLRPKDMGISIMTISGHKIYTPKGVGAIYVDKNIRLEPLIHGGSQEMGHRAGTENVGAIMAFGKAANLIHNELEKEHERLLELRDFFLQGLKKIIPDFIINGSLEHRIPNNLSLGFPNVDSGSLLLSLNHIGIYASSGSACSAGSKEASYVIKALGVDTDKYGIMRFSFGISNTKEDVEYTLKHLPDILKLLS